MKQRLESTVGFVTQLSDRLIEQYLAVLSETEPKTTAFLEKKFALQQAPSEKNVEAARVAKARRIEAYIDFWNGLDEEQQYLLSAHDAKVNQLLRVARVIGTTEVVDAHNKLKPSTAGSIDYVLMRFREEGVTAKQVQKFINENAKAWFSLTGHPTNPATVEYTKAQTQVAYVLSGTDATTEDLTNALRSLRDIPIVGNSKTPLEEADETLNTLDVIFDTALAHKRLFEAALDKYGYAAEGVEIKKPLIRPCVWTLGDGDGNVAMTEQVLEDGIALHRERIAARYCGYCAAIIDAAKGDDARQGIKELAEKIKLRSACAEDLAGEADALSGRIDDKDTAHQLEGLAYLLRCFGLGFGKIDIRHNALDILETVTALLDCHRIMARADFTALGSNEKATLLAKWLEDESLLKVICETKTDQLKENETAARLLGRLQVIGRNSDMCEKLIIAEATHATDALAALLLLKVTGNAVASTESCIDLVTLTESVADLVELGNTLKTMLHNHTFRKHVASRGQLVAMIAKSDTTRQDGRGEAEYAQYEAAVEIYRIADVMKRQYPELEPVLVSVKNGGGHALQRGGGRVTEVPAVHGRAAADARVTEIGPSTLTIQGHQQTILFCPGKTALGTLEALAAQNLYTKAGIHGEMLPPPYPKSINKQYAQRDAWLYAKRAGEAFDALVKNNPAVDELLVAAPWLAMKAGNVSSRPAKRGEKPAGPGITPAEAKGENPRALEGRAISGERLTGHACLPVFSVLGLREAMEAVRQEGAARVNAEKYGDALHHLYRAHKIHRDAARATVNVAQIADFDIAWPLLTGRPRPSRQEVKTLAGQFTHSSNPGVNRPDVTMAFLESYFLDVEKLTYEMITGKEPKANISHGAALAQLWPELAQQVHQRDRNAEFARVIECYRTRQFDAAPSVPLSEKAFRITQALYAAANVVSAPVGILATRTRLEPVQEIGSRGRTRFMRPQSFLEDTVLHLLKIPPALQ